MASERRRLPPALEQLVDTGRGYFGRVRVKVFSLVLGIGLAAAALVVWTSLSWIPVTGIALAAAIVAVHRAGHRLVEPVCYNCGQELKGLPDGEYGILCPGCGALHQGRRMALGNKPDPRSVNSAGTQSDDSDTPVA